MAPVTRRSKAATDGTEAAKPAAVEKVTKPAKAEKRKAADDASPAAVKKQKNVKEVKPKAAATKKTAKEAAKEATEEAPAETTKEKAKAKKTTTTPKETAKEAPAKKATAKETAKEASAKKATAKETTPKETAKPKEAPAAKKAAAKKGSKKAPTPAPEESEPEEEDTSTALVVRDDGDDDDEEGERVEKELASIFNNFDTDDESDGEPAEGGFKEGMDVGTIPAPAEGSGEKGKKQQKKKQGDDDDEEDEGEDVDDKGEGTSKKPKPRRQNLLLINKSDLLTRGQRERWADYFDANGIQYAFFSAANGIALQEERARQEELAALAEQSDESDSEEDDLAPGMKIPKSGNKLKGLNAQGKKAVQSAAATGSSGAGGAEASRPRVTSRDVDTDDESDEDSDEELAGRMRRGMGISLPGSDESPRTRILSVLELEDLFMSRAPEVSLAAGHGNEKLVVGLVGYPNVGKSSTINALIGEKKVSVSATPGKTKHFQTIRLSQDVLLCDCPGLVFPQFASTKAELVCNGVLPIDQLREFTGPVELVTRRIPQQVLEGTYGLRINVLPENEGGTGYPTAAEFLTTFSIARGFFTGGAGNQDHSRSSRHVLKDYVTGRLLFCHPPPGVTEDDFNAETRSLDHLAAQNKLKRKMAPTTRVGKDSDYYVHSPAAIAAGVAGASAGGGKGSARANAIDERFFGGGVGNAVVLGTRAKKEAEEGKGDGKKHFKKKREKQRSGRGYD